MNRSQARLLLLLKTLDQGMYYYGEIGIFLSLNSEGFLFQIMKSVVLSKESCHPKLMILQTMQPYKDYKNLNIEEVQVDN